MGIKYDAERFMDDLLVIIRENLNLKINEIQAEKDTLLGSGNFAVPTIETAAYFDSLDERVANFDPYVYYGLGDNTVIQAASAESSDLTAFFTVVLHYNGSDASMYRKMLRYVRALQEIISENYDTIPEVSRLKVTAISPQDLRDLDESTFHKIAGVSIQAAIA